MRVTSKSTSYRDCVCVICVLQSDSNRETHPLMTILLLHEQLCDVLLETKFPDGRYSVVAAQDKEFAAKCKFNGEPFYDPDKHLFLNTTVRGEPVDMWGFIYRQIVSRYQRDGTPDKSVAYARDTCQNIGK